MRLAFCLFHYFPFGGLQRDFLRIACECQTRGHYITIYTYSWTGELPRGFQLHLLSKQGLTNHQRAKNFVKQAMQLFAKTPYDLIIGFNKMPGLDIYFAADPCYVAATPWWKKFTVRYRIYKQFEQAVFSPSLKTKVLLLTPQQQKDFQQYYHTPNERLTLLPPGLPPAFRTVPFHQRTQWRKQFDIDESSHIILMVCSYFKTKGLDRALHAMAALPDTIKKNTFLFVVGNDSPMPYFPLIKRLNLHSHVRFFGAQIDVIPFYVSADILLHPAYREAAGLVLIEALACGVPILTTDICGHASHVVAADAGIVLPSPFSAKQCHTSTKAMLTSPQQRQRWHNNARYYAQQQFSFDQTKWIATYIEEIGVEKTKCN